MIKTITLSKSGLLAIIFLYCCEFSAQTILTSDNSDIKATARAHFFDSDGDGILDNYDIDDDNDGIEDIIEELACKNSNISTYTNYKFLKENFGTGNRTEINTTFDAKTSYCYEDGTASCSSFDDANLNDGEYTVFYGAPNDNVNNHKSTEAPATLNNSYWYNGEDHSTGDINGRMALFNASIDPGIFYTARIAGSLPNIPITYSFWALNLDTTDTPNIDSRLRPNIRVEFRDLDDNFLASIVTGEIPPSVNGHPASSWHNYTTDLTFPVSEFNVFFYNIQPGGAGNAIAIDDIEIKQNLCDSDNDGVANMFDLDSDNDGIPDVIESGFGSISNGKAIIQTWQDNNRNGMHDAFEGRTLLDSDTDGTPNVIDLDSDNDSLFDVDESSAGNTGNPNFQNGDGDINGDGIGDGPDTDTVRPKDFNSDGILEFFTDGILDVYDYYNGNTFTSAYGNSGQGIGYTNYVLDSDADNVPDYIDTFNDITSTFDISHTLYKDLDSNGDGIIDGTFDEDGDGLLDAFDTDDTNFGSPRDLDQKLQLYFDGRNDYVQDTSITSDWHQITLMGWIKIAPSFRDTRFLFGQNNFYLSLLSDGRLSLSVDRKEINYSDILPTNQWIHVGATYSNTTNLLKLFINGEPVKELNKSGRLRTDTSLFTIGRNPSSNTHFFNGHIDEVRLFDKALSEEEFQKIIYQEIKNNGTVKGNEIPRDIATLSWSNLKRYYRFDNFKDDITDDLSTPNVDVNEGAKLYNIKTIKSQSAPMPFITKQGNLSLPDALTVESEGINGSDAITYDWSIVRIEHSDITYDSSQKHLGLFINENDDNLNPIEYHITNNSELNVSWYLKLNGFIDLEGESQLVQGDDSFLETGDKGQLERDHQGTADMYTYNYWSSPVYKSSDSSNNTDYTLNDVLRDGTEPTTPKEIDWKNSGYDGTNTDPIGLASYWIWKLNNYLIEDFSLWQHIRNNGTLTAGEGFTIKGPGTGTFLEDQNYVFVGKPNNGDINLELKAGSNYLLGNPYPSAMDAYQFISENGSDDLVPAFSGSLYFLQHWGGGSHLLSDFQGGYGIYNLSGAVGAASFGTNDADVSTDGTPTKLPSRYIPVGQGFFVLSENTGILKFRNRQRLFRTEADFSSEFKVNNDTSISQTNRDVETIDPRMKFRIGFNSVNTIYRQLLLTIDSLATPSVDYGFDAAVLDDLIDDMYWLIEGKKYTIQAIDFVDENTVIPIGIHVKNSGENKISIDALENVPEDINIYLHDKGTDFYHDMRTSYYQLQLEAGTYLNRFEITFSIPNTLTIEEENFNNLKFYYAYTRNKIVILNPKGAELEHLEVLNIMGQSVFEVRDLYQTSYNEYEISNLSTGAYVARLRSSSGTITKKIIIK